MSSGQAALLKVKAARELMLAKEAQEDARDQEAGSSSAPPAPPPAINPADQNQNEVVMDP